jgi:hypothetical protein
MTGSISVVNRADQVFGFSIMRPTTLGNPFAIGKAGTREQVILKYKRWLWQNMQRHTAQLQTLCEFANLVRDGQHINLICCCKPKSCHGDVVASAIMWLLKK